MVFFMCETERNIMNVLRRGFPNVCDLLRQDYKDTQDTEYRVRSGRFFAAREGYDGTLSPCF